jgi:probable F420-dependent oxidoreductase
MSELKFGMILPIQAQSTLMRMPWEPEASAADIVKVAQACEAAGFDNVSVCDHVAIPRARAEAMSTVWYDTVATMGWLAAQTQRVKLMSQVFIVAYRHPLVTAKSFLTLDALSNGRTILGVGAGHVEGEFDELGVPFHERGRITNDALKVIRASFEDEFGAGEVGQAPRPVQPGGPPIWVGGSSNAALRRAARLGDGWIPQGPTEGGMEGAIALLRSEREKAGKTGAFAINSGASLYVGDPGWDVGPYATTGDAEKVAASLRPLSDMGVTHLQLRIPSRSLSELTDQISALGSDVIPLVNA